MAWNIPVQIETSNIYLRPLESCDLESFVQFMTNPQATQYLVFSEAQKTEAGATELFQTVIDSYTSSEPLFVLAITRSVHEPRYLGSCGLSPLDDSNEAECFYTLLPQYWKQGWATKAIQALIDYGLTKLKLKRIYAFADPDHQASHQVAERAGMMFQGARQHPQIEKLSFCYLIQHQF